MKAVGGILAIIGVVLVILGVARHFSAFVLPTTNHASIILAVVGVVVLLVGAAMTRTGSSR